MFFTILDISVLNIFQEIFSKQSLFYFFKYIHYVKDSTYTVICSFLYFHGTNLVFFKYSLWGVMHSKTTSKIHLVSFHERSETILITNVDCSISTIILTSPGYAASRKCLKKAETICHSLSSFFTPDRLCCIIFFNNRGLIFNYFLNFSHYLNDSWWP